MEPIMERFQQLRTETESLFNVLEEYVNGLVGGSAPALRATSYPDPPKLIWTAPKVALVELLYALQEYGVFNNTKLEVKKLADYFEKIFQTDLRNVYKSYEDIRLRKKNRTPFLDALKSSLLRRMDEDDLSAL